MTCLGAARVTERKSTALAGDALTSADKKCQTGTYEVGAEYEDYNNDEFFYVLKGSIKLTDIGGAQGIAPGRAVTIPTRVEGTLGH